MLLRAAPWLPAIWQPGQDLPADSAQASRAPDETAHERTHMIRTQHGARLPVVIRPGDLDICTAADFADTLRQVNWAGAGTVVVDLTDTDFFDEAGIEMIIAAAEQAAASGCRFGVVCIWWPILRMLQAAGLTETLDIAASTGELTTSGSRRPGLPSRLSRLQSAPSHQDAAS
jgi:anti-anti-sigma factor